MTSPLIHLSGDFGVALSSHAGSRTLISPYGPVRTVCVALYDLAAIYPDLSPQLERCIRSLEPLLKEEMQNEQPNSETPAPTEG